MRVLWMHISSKCVIFISVSSNHFTGGAKVLDPIIKIGSFLNEEEYENTIVTLLVKLFAMPDRTIRLSLLENFSIFIDNLSEKVINDKIFSHMVSTNASSFGNCC